MDNDEIRNLDSRPALEALNRDLSTLLHLPDPHFWKVAQKSPTLHTSLDAYLRFRRRVYDFCENGQVSHSHLHQELSKHVFFVMMRLVTVPDKETVSFRQEQATWIYDQWIVDVPKILDICVLYGRKNKALVQEWMQRLFQLQPKSLQDFDEAIRTLVDNLYHLQERCSSSLQLMAQGDAMGLFGWSDVVKYLLDICINLTALLDVYPPAGSLLLSNDGTLLCTLSTIHDGLLPQFEGALRETTGMDQEIEELQKQVHLVLAAIEKASFQMIRVTFLSPDCGEGSKNALTEEILMQRGQQMMTVLMSIAQLDDRDLSLSLLFRVNTRFELGEYIILAVEQGLLSLDDAQYDYLNMLLPSSRRPQSLRSVKESDSVPAYLTSKPSSSNAPVDSQRAVILSKIHKIKEVLPDLGDGFLERCLAEFDMDSEKVLLHVLDGSLPKKLAQLDRHMPLSDGNETNDGPSRQFHGEQTSSRDTFFKQFLFPDSVAPGWNASYNETPPSSNIKDWARVKVGTDKKIDRKTARFFDQSGADIRQIVIRQANALLSYDYDDEYDDSYDDLGVGGTDGQADVEGDDIRMSKESKKPYFVKDGKIYNAPKEGAVAVKGLVNAQTAAANRDDETIHGLGKGGNIPINGQPGIVTASNPRGRGRGRGGRKSNHRQKERNLRKHQR